MKKTILVAFAALFTVPMAFGQTVEAFDNSTVRPDGPTTNPWFFNIQGDANGEFASYGVADWDASNWQDPLTVASIAEAQVSLTQSNAGFTTDGPMLIWWTGNTGLDISDSGPLTYDDTYAPAGVDPNVFTSLELLATVDFVETASGDVDNYVLDLTPAAEAGMVGAINAGETIRLLFTANSSTTSATYAGFNNNTYEGPQLSLRTNPVPEPATMLALGAGLAALAARRRRSN